MSQNLRDAKLRLRFAEAYLLELTDERDSAANPATWDRQLLDAIRRLNEARALLECLRMDSCISPVSK